MTKKTNTLTVRLVGREIELSCACGLMLTQKQRDPIAEHCPKCRRRWRR